MKTYFSGKMGFGRYPEKTIAEVFGYDRNYFDQVLYKNARFRAEYSRALHKWLDEVGPAAGNSGVATMRALLAVELMGEDKAERLFGQLVSYLNAQWPDRTLPEDFNYRDALVGNYDGLGQGYGTQIEKMETFWQRLAIPMVEEI